MDPGSLSFVVELDVPVEVVAPALRRVAEPDVMRIAGAESGRRGSRCSFMPASAGVRPPFFRLQFTQQVTMFSQSLRPPCATGTTWSNVNSAVGYASLQYWHVCLSRA